MSLTLTVHVGPYAELLVPKGRGVNQERLEAALSSGGLNHNLESDDVVVLDGTPHRRACFAPYFSRHSPPEHRPPRPMHWSDDQVVKAVSALDLTGVNMTAEMAWFEGAYASELQALAEGYDVPVRVCWGVLPSFG